MKTVREAPTPGRTVESDEAERFAKLAADWWNPKGPVAPLHTANAFRVDYLKRKICAHFGRDPGGTKPLDGLRILDVGCGGGLVSEGLARLGASVVGIDPVAELIGVARLHAAESGLAIDYRSLPVEAVASDGELFDAVVALEVVEHVSNVAMFVGACGGTVKPSGLMIASTENRTLLSFLLLIVMAEYVLRWIPIGTHHYNMLVTPNELRQAFQRAGFDVESAQGVKYDPFKKRLALSRSLAFSYAMVAVKKRP